MDADYTFEMREPEHVEKLKDGFFIRSYLVPSYVSSVRNPLTDSDERR